MSTLVYKRQHISCQSREIRRGRLPWVTKVENAGLTSKAASAGVGMAHVRRYHEHYHSHGGGRLYGVRLQSLPGAEDNYFLTVCCYVEANSMNLFEHLERYLGETAGGWKDPPGEHWPFQVLQFSGGPVADVTTLCTRGLSSFPLVNPTSAKVMRHELIFMVRSAFGCRNIPAILHDIGKEAIDRERPYLRGELIGPRGKLFSDTEMEALLLFTPVYLPEEFWIHSSAGGETHFFVWTIPITGREARYVAANGWQPFVDTMAQVNPDLLDMYRPSIVP
jgi:hypothetical protein